MATNPQLQRAGSQESILSLTSCVSGIGTWQVGDRARIDQRSGTVAYVGPTKFAPGDWIGLVLDDPAGKNDGSVQGYRYFSCTPGHGLFCKSSKLEKIVLSPPQYRSPSPSREPKSQYAAEYGFDIGDRVVVTGGKQGVVRFIGETEFAQGIWAGIELEQPLGKNDGSVQGKRYFTCKTPYGVFVPASKTQRAASQTPNKLKHQSYASRISENATIKALQEALQEKERHLEQLMRERDMEHSEIGQSEHIENANEIARLKAEKKTLKTELLTKEKLIEDLTFRLDEAIISKDCQLEDLKKDIVSNLEDEGSLDTHAALTSEIKSLKHELALLRRENERSNDLLETEKKEREACVLLADGLRVDIEALERLLGEEKAVRCKLEEDARSKSSEIAELRNIIGLTEGKSDECRAQLDLKLVAKNAELTKVSEERDVALSEMQAAERKVTMLSSQIQELEQKQLEHEKKLIESEAKQSKLCEELSEAKDRNDQLAGELATSGRELVRLNTKLEDFQTAANENEENKLHLDRLRCEQAQLKERLQSVELEKEELLDALNARKDNEGEMVQLLNRQLTAANNLNVEYLKDKEKLMADIDTLTKKIATMFESEEAIKKETSIAEAKANQILSERQTLENRLQELLHVQDALKMKVMNLEHEKESMQSQHSKELESLRNEMTEQIAFSSQMLQQARDELESETRKVELIGDEKLAVESELSDMKRELAAKNEELEQLLAREAATRSKLNGEARATSDEFLSLQAHIEQLNSKIVNDNYVLGKLQSEIAEKNNELENASKERNAALSEKQAAEEKLMVMSTQVKQLENKLSEALQAIEVERTKSSGEIKAQETKLRGELSAAEQKNVQLSNELKLNVEELSRLNSELEESKTHSNEAESLKSQLEQLRIKQAQTKDQVEQLQSEREHLVKAMSSSQDKEEQEVRLLKQQLSAANQSSVAYREEKGKLMDDIETLTKKVAASLETEQTLQEEIHKATLQIAQLLSEKELLHGQLQEAVRDKDALKENVDRLEREKLEAHTNQEKGTEELLLLSSRLESANLLNEEYMKENEKFVADMEALKKQIAERIESEEVTKKEVDGLRKELAQIISEKESLEERLQAEFHIESDLKENIARLQCEKEAILQRHKEELVSTVLWCEETAKEKMGQQAHISMSAPAQESEQEKLLIEHELQKLKDELAEKNQEVISLRLFEANTNAIVSEAKQKIDIYDELEKDWQKKQLRLCEKIEELSSELELARSRTASEEAERLKQELAFTNSIIADQRRKEMKLLQEIEALKNFSVESISNDKRRMSFGNRDAKPRKYCDICEVFDKHETEDCPKQEVEEQEVVQPKVKKPLPPPRDYCDHCEMFGHDTSNCSAHEKKKKKDYTF